MSYVVEQDDLRPEVPSGGSTVVSVWPKRLGLNTTADAGATYTLHDPSGTQLSGGTVDPTAVTLGARSVSRFDVSISGLSDLDEDYQLRLTWTDATAGDQHTEIVLFDVSAAPLGALVSLNDLMELEPDVDEVLDRLGARLGYAAGQTAQEAAAAVYASLARQTLEARLSGRASADNEIRPAMLLDRTAVRRVERQWALAHLYSALGGSQDGEGDASDRYRHWMAGAEAAFAALRVRYSTTAELSPSGTTEAFGTYVIERVQA